MSSFSPDSEPNTVDTNTESLQYSESLKESESKWKGDKLSWFSKAGFWSSAQSYLGRITSAVQEETQGLTLSKVKKDLEEFSQQLYSEVQGLQMAISKESEKQKETNRGVVADSFVPFIPNDGTNESQKVSSGKEYTSHHSQMNSENVDDSLYWVPEPFCQLMEPFLSHYRMKALEVHNNPALFLDVSIPKDESQSFNEEMESVVDSLSPQILERCSCIKQVYERIVPNKMDSRRFWSLYFYKLYSIAVEERKKQSLLSTNIHNLSTEEDSLGQDWSSEEDAPVAESLPVIEWEEEQQSDETEY